MNNILNGLTVVDFTQVAAGPVCTMMLADRGADVIKVETPSGDLGRQLGPPWQNGQGVIYLSLNRNKRSIVLDLKDANDREIAQQLISRADILVESFRPGVMERLGLDYQSVQKLKPDLIYCSISAYGQEGASRDKPGVDGIIQAVSGLMSVTGAANSDPSKVQAPIIDMVTGFLGTLAIMDALYARERTGEGQWLDISMYACALQLQQTGLASYLSSSEIPQPCGSGAPYSAPNEAYPTKDGWLMVAAYHEQRWGKFCRLLELDSLVDDARFKSSTDRVLNRDALFEHVSAAMRKKTTHEWIKLFEAEDIICGPVANYRDVTTSEQFKSSKPLVQIDHPEAGPVQVVGPLRTSASHKQQTTGAKPPPRLGEHTSEILAELSASRKACSEGSGSNH